MFLESVVVNHFHRLHIILGLTSAAFDVYMYRLVVVGV